MSGREHQLILNEATSQADRWRGAPAPEDAKVDSRSLADLLSFAAEYGALIVFYDRFDQPDGNWSTFFAEDESIRLALCAGLNLAEIEAEFDQLLESLLTAGNLETRLERVRLATKVLLRLVRLIDLGRHDPRDLEEALARLAVGERADLLRQPARKLAMHVSGRTLENALERDPETYSGDWFRVFVEYLREVVDALMTALEQMQPEAAVALKASFSSRDHAPQAALYDAFATLFRHAQDSVNRFSGRFAEFYRTGVLKQASRAGAPDQLDLAFQPATGVSVLSLPRGTRFTAGQDAEGATIAYALDNALEVNSAELAYLGMFTVTHSSASSSQTVAPAPRLPAQVFTSIATLAPEPPRIAEPFPLFGATAAGKTESLATSLASLGFAVVSSTLLLAGGARTIQLTLSFTQESLATAMAALAVLGVPAEGDAGAASLAAVLEAAFALRYSTHGGWISIASYGVAPPADSASGAYVLTIELDSNASPVAPLSGQPPDPAATPPEGGAANLDAETPILIADLNQALVEIAPGVSLYPYSVLSSLALSTLSLNVTVTGLTDLVVANSGTPVDTTQPFLTFGSPPNQNSTLDISSEELFQKVVSNLSINIEWFGLPVDQKGFYNYYFSYVIDVNGTKKDPGELFNNAIFTGSISINNPGYWTLQPNSQQLFRTAPPTGSETADAPNPDPKGTLVPAVSLSPTVVGNTAPPMYDPTASSIQLSLTDPDYTFGNVIYAANVMEASVQLTAAASACAQECGSCPEVASAVAHLKAVETAAETAPDDRLAASLKSSVAQAVSGLDGEALAEIGGAISAIGDETARSGLKSSLSDALASSKGPAPSLIQRVAVWRENPPDYANVHATLTTWCAENADALAAADPTAQAHAKALLEAGDSLGKMLGQTAPLAPAVARPVAALWLKRIADHLEATIGVSCQDCVQKCLDRANLLGLPNAPWLPTASALSIDYSASTQIPADGMARYYWLEPFDTFSLPTWPGDGGGPPVSLLAPLTGDGGLYIGLSEPADALSLLFQLTQPAGGWPIDTPALSWNAQAPDGQWANVTPMVDTTHNLRNPGIVSLSLADAASLLRIDTPRDAAAFPNLAGLIPNAATATWVGPGGAEQLGTPLPAGTVDKPVDANPSLGSVWQPEPSMGGRPKLAGRPFDIWLAERLRHKDRAIDSWDYARLVLAEFPMLWQLAVVPASGDGLGPAPGSVWIVPIPGPDAAGVADPTEPTNGADLLEAIREFLAGRISPFIQLSVTNPPYQRLTVSADVIFTDEDALEANKTHLNNDLVTFLSPWPPKAPRPPDYYTRREVARFIRHRPYVKGIRSLELIPEVIGKPGWRYLTSALSHHIVGTSEPTKTPDRPAVGARGLQDADS